MDFNDIMFSLILLFIFTVIFYAGDPIYTGFLATWTDMMADDTVTYDATVRNWRLTVPAVLFVCAMMIVKGIRKDKYAGYGGGL